MRQNLICRTNDRGPNGEKTWSINLQPAIDSAVIEIESKPADFERFSSALVLAGVDSRIQLFQYVVVARE
jgi:hypothetical protein